MEFHEVDAALSPAPLPIETGYEPLPNGALHVAAWMDMHGCTGEMLEWWFRWRCDTQKYTWGHPVDHVFSDWRDDLREDTHVGGEHIVTEHFTGLPAHDLIIQFRGPTEFFAPVKDEVARGDGSVSCAVVARIGVAHEPPRTEDSQGLGGRLLHTGRDTDRGFASRSHFYIGPDLVSLGLTPEQITGRHPRTSGSRFCSTPTTSSRSSPGSFRPCTSPSTAACRPPASRGECYAA